MYQIELDHTSVSDRLGTAEQALSQLSLPQSAPPGRNQLALTGAFQDGEQMVAQLLSAYLAGVRKNLADTRANVDLLKRQDEVIK